MFEKLRRKWNVSTRQFWIIFIVFGLTGTTAAYLTKAITSLTGMGPHTHWGWKLLLRLGMLLIGYQILLLFYGTLFGQLKFFWKYERKILEKLRILKPIQDPRSNVQDPISGIPTSAHQHISTPAHRIAIFASGAGSNAKKIIEHFHQHPNIRIVSVVSNKPHAGVLKIAAEHAIEPLIIEKERFFNGDAYIKELKEKKVNFIVLAGFLWKVPDALISTYPNSIINIHPALLPKYGGKGMYGERVHQAVIEAKEKVSGITIHYVDGHYDNGDIIFQAECEVNENDSTDSLAQKVHQLEHQYFPQVIENILVDRS